MSTESLYLTTTMAAANDYRVARALHKVVNVCGDFSIAAAVQALGLAKSQPNSGFPLTVGYFGEMKSYFGAAGNTLGVPLTATASGFVIAAVSGSHVIGRSLETANSGDLRRALFNFTTPRALG